MADKFGISSGDEVTLKEEYKDKTYTFKVSGTYKYDAGITVFMNRADYLKTFNERKYKLERQLGSIENNINDLKKPT